MKIFTRLGWHPGEAIGQNDRGHPNPILVPQTEKAKKSLSNKISSIDIDRETWQSKWHRSSNLHIEDDDIATRDYNNEGDDNLTSSKNVPLTPTQHMSSMSLKKDNEDTDAEIDDEGGSQHGALVDQGRGL